MVSQTLGCKVPASATPYRCAPGCGVGMFSLAQELGASSSQRGHKRGVNGELAADPREETIGNDALAPNSTRKGWVIFKTYEISMYIQILRHKPLTFMARASIHGGQRMRTGVASFLRNSRAHGATRVCLPPTGVEASRTMGSLPVHRSTLCCAKPETAQDGNKRSGLDLDGQSQLP